MKQKIFFVKNPHSLNFARILTAILPFLGLVMPVLSISMGIICYIILLCSCAWFWSHNFIRISDAIQHAKEGTIINIDEGHYNENLVITKSLILAGPTANLSRKDFRKPLVAFSGKGIAKMEFNEISATDNSKVSANPSISLQSWD